MFYQEKIKNKYYIYSDNIKGKFGPFNWIYIKNKYLWDINPINIDENKYPGYKYSIWVNNNKLFIINENWIEKIKK